MNAFPMSRTGVQSWIKGRIALMAALLAVAGAVTGQTTEGHIIPNFADVDFIELVEAVSKATGKSFIVDPRIHARVTLVAKKELSPAAFYEAFLSIVHVHGLVAKTDGNVVSIFPDPKPEPDKPKAPGFIRIGLP